jgi:hypothetical protein
MVENLHEKNDTKGRVAKLGTTPSPATSSGQKTGFSEPSCVFPRRLSHHSLATADHPTC